VHFDFLLRSHRVSYWQAAWLAFSFFVSFARFLKNSGDQVSTTERLLRAKGRRLERVCRTQLDWA
jgi:hypothetical protein